jgi:lysophospholipid acyltransferase (LPLAT)-like uncharacterized protein
VLPFHLEASSHWTLRSWDGTQIPKPFATVSLVIGAPMEVAGGLDAQAIERARAALQQHLQALEPKATALLHR